MKFNFPLDVSQPIQGFDENDYEHKLRSFCDKNRWRCSFTWNTFTCGSTVMWFEMTGLKRKRNVDGSLMINPDGSHQNIKFTIYTTVRRFPPNISVRDAKQYLSLSILNEINKDYQFTNQPQIFFENGNSFLAQYTNPNLIEPETKDQASQHEEIFDDC